MSAETVRRFMDGLTMLERERDVEALVAVFAEGADVGNVVSPRAFAGREGARDFWTTYRGSFGEVESSFRNVIAEDGRAALEWTTRGTSPEGKPVEYDGVSILEFAGDAVTRFRAYFNPEALGQQMQAG